MALLTNGACRLCTPTSGRAAAFPQVWAGGKGGATTAIAVVGSGFLLKHLEIYQLFVDD